MKKALSLLILGTLGVLSSSNAFAMHAYRHEICEAKVGNSAIQIGRGLGDSNGGVLEKDLSAAYQGLAGDLDAPSDDADLRLSILSDSKKAALKVDDGCFVGESGSFRRKANVISLSPEARMQLDVRADQTLEMNCFYEDLAPTGPSCE